MHSINHMPTVKSSFAIRLGSSPSPHRQLAQWAEPLWGAEPGFELGPALQQADELPTELRCTLLPPFLTSRLAETSISPLPGYGGRPMINSSIQREPPKKI